jgi:hypothetical protein
MSQDDPTAPSVRVINEEYERVLSNPDNIIVSEELRALMSLDLNKEQHVDPVAVDTMTIILFDEDSLPYKVCGQLSELSSKGDMYTIKVISERVSKDVLGLLEVSRQALPTATPARVLVEGMYDLDLSVNIVEWSLKRSSTHALELQISFRSSNVIF